MKVLQILPLFLAIIMMVSTCKKSDNSASNAPFQFKLNGEFNSISQDSTNVEIITTQKVLSINGYYKGHELYISFYHVKVGTFVVGAPDDVQIWYRPKPFADDRITYKATSGNVTITNLTPTSISGTFRVDAGDFTLTGGKFTDLTIDSSY